MPNRFCPLCGVLMRPRSSSPHDAASALSLEWFEEVRAVRSTKGTLAPYLTGVGYLLDDTDSEITAPADSRARYDDIGVPMHRYRIGYPSALFWAFPLHDACSKIFSIQVSGSEGHDAEVERCLFHLLLSASIDAHGYHSFCQDLGEANGFQPRHDNPIQLCANTAQSFIFADPYQSLDFAALQNDSKVIENIAAFSAKLDCGSSIRLRDCFGRLPHEIIQEILINLPSHDVTQARLSSRAIAIASTISGLQQSFWKSRFDANFEMGFMLFVPSKPEFSVDWRRRYYMVRFALSRPGQFSSLKNRKRIWVALSQITSLARFLLRSGKLLGMDGPSTENELISKSRDLFPDCSFGQVVSGDINGDEFLETRRQYRRGCRELEVKCLQLPALARRVSLGMSTLAFNNQRYISGLRVLCNKTELPASPSAMGFILKETESIFCLESMDYLRGIEVALISTGIVSIRFITGDTDKISDWFGERPENTPGVGFSRLVVQAGHRICGFMAGFDACKFVSLRLLECPQKNNVSLESANNPGTTFHNTRIWKPRIPLHLAAPEDMDPQLQPPSCHHTVFNIDFGGIDGHLLCCLTRVSAILDGELGGLIGFVFFYHSGSSCLYGRVGGVERTFLIDGPSGERIVRVDVEDGAPNDIIGVRSLKLHTNFGNSFNCGFNTRPVTPMSKRTKVNTLEAASDRVIIGFIATEGEHTGSFMDLSITTRKVDGPPLGIIAKEVEKATKSVENTSSDSLASLDVGNHIIGEQSKPYSVAPLHDIRRMRVSRGCEGRSRKPSTISGIWIEYWGSTNPKILGQWFQEDHVLELDQDEIITGISFWMSPQRTSPEGSAKLGQVVGLNISTSSSKSFFIGDGVSNRLFEIAYQRNRLQELILLSWALNSFWDHPRVITMPRLLPDNLTVVQPHIGGTWLVPQIIPWEDRTTTGTICRIRSIIVYANSDHIISLSFKYSTGKVRHIGPRPQAQQSTPTELTFSHDEFPVKLEMGWSMKGLHEIFIHAAPVSPIPDNHTTQPDGSVASRCLTTKTKGANELEKHHLPYQHIFDLQKTSNANDAPIVISEGTSQSSPYRRRLVYSCPPGAKFCGFWARASSRHIRVLGVVYEPCNTKV